MVFAEKLKQIRKDRKLSQEDLAELLDVSRQAVSKWENGTGYPEVEKLLILSDKLNVSLDSLLGIDIADKEALSYTNITGKIVITSPYENVIATCYKIFSSQEMKGGNGAPKYFLIGASGGEDYLLGESKTLLGWYADKDDITKEIRAIQNAIVNGISEYELRYSVKVKRRFLSIKIAND